MVKTEQEIIDDYYFEVSVVHKEKGTVCTHIVLPNTTLFYHQGGYYIPSFKITTVM